MPPPCSTYSFRRRRLRLLALLISGMALLLFVAFVRSPRVGQDENSEIMVPLPSHHANQEEYIDRRGVHVVVGHYIGDDIPGRVKPNLTKEMLNSNDYNPQPGAGENGLAVHIPPFEISKMQQLYHINSFNLLASDRISLNRSLPDVRKKRKSFTSKEMMNEGLGISVSSLEESSIERISPETFLLIVWWKSGIICQVGLLIVLASTCLKLSWINISQQATSSKMIHISHPIGLVSVGSASYGSCQEKTYPAVSELPSTSVVIVFHNEAWSTLLRTVHSVINRSPSKLLKEIILVDDASERTFLKEPLDDYVTKLPIPVKVLRMSSRSGLIRARLLGARESTGSVLTFLDAHCEVSPGWLEPLLARIYEDPTRVVCPIIDIIDDDSFQYVRSFEVFWGAFNWNLHFRWFAMGRQEVERRKHDVAHVFRTPAMAGGLFSIDKKFFYDIGSYDKNMDIWGGENLEMSFRVWMCGGSVETVPCSHVGHVFRKSSPYTFPGKGGVGGILYRNLARLALVWMDEWANFYFKMNPEAEMVMDKVSVKERQLLRKKLQCHDFEWYLNNIWEFNFFPSHDGFFGKIRNKGASQCLQRPQPNGSSNHWTGAAALKECVIETYAPQTFIFKKQGYIMTDENICLDAPDASSSTTEAQVRFSICSETGRQRWTYDESNYQIKHIGSLLCLDLPTKNNPESLSLQKCSDSSWTKSQKWIFEHEDWTNIR